MAGLTVSLMALGMVCPVLPAGESRALEVDGNAAVSQAVDQGVTYFYTDLKGYKNAVEIVGIDASNGPSTLRIPEKLNGKTVESIDLYPWEYDLKPVTFAQYETIKKIILPKSIRSLRDTSAEGKLLKLTSLVTLQQLENLESIETVTGSKYVKAKDGILYSADMKEMIAYPPQNKIKTYTMPSSVTWSAGIRKNPHLQKIVFSKNKKYKKPIVYNCDNLESIYLPDNITKVQYIGHCHKLKTIRWSKNLKTIGDGAFEDCDAFTKVIIPGTVRNIEDRAFRWCSDLKEVTLPDSIAYVGSEAFGKTKKDLAAGQPKVTYKKASYLISAKNKKIVSGVTGYQYDKYIAVVKVTKKKKTKYYDSRLVAELKPSAKNVILRRGKSKKLTFSPRIEDYTRTREGGRMNPEILNLTSSNPKVAKVTAKGVVKARKKGKATITVKMKTSSVKCKVRVTVR